MSIPREQPSDVKLRAIYNQAIIKGKELVGELNSFRVRPSSSQLLRDLYEVESGTIAAKYAVPDNLVRGYIKVPKLKWVDISSPLAKDEPDTAYSYFVSGSAGLLVINEVHKDRDKNRPGQTFKPSELAWQSFLLGAEQDGVLPTSLRDIVVSHVVNENTRDVILETTRVSTSLLSKDHGHQEFTQVDDGFHALLGSVLGKSVLHMLLDHKAEIGYRCVDRVILVGKKDLQPDQARSFIVVLSEPRPRKRAASELANLPSTKRRKLNNSMDYIIESELE